MAKEVPFQVRLSAAEKELLDTLAAHLGESRSTVVRRALRALAREEGIRPGVEYDLQLHKPTGDIYVAQWVGGAWRGISNPIDPVQIRELRATGGLEDVPLHKYVAQEYPPEEFEHYDRTPPETN